MNILFICLGNICRSPAAEAVFCKKAEARGLSHLFVVDSAGTYGGHAGQLPDVRMRNVAAKRGYRLTHRARRLQVEDFWEFDLLLVMDDSNYGEVRRLCPDVISQQKIHHLVEYCGKNSVSYIPDPYYEGADGFEHVLDLLEDACDGLLDKMSFM